MMRSLLIILLLIVANSLFAQSPSIDDSIMSIKGKWTKSQNVIIGEDPSLKPNQFPFIYKKLDSIATLIRQAYPTPTGTQADWHASVRGKPYFTGGPSPYSYNASFKYYYYNKNYKKIIPADETGTWLYVFVNDLNWLVDYSGIDITVNGNIKKAWELPSMIGEWKGYTVYDQENFSPNVKTVVVTKNGRMPWKPVSQLEYLQALRLKKENEKLKAIADADAGIEKGKKMIEDIKNSKSYAADMKEKMIVSAQQALNKQIDLKDRSIKTAEEIFERDSKVIDDYISTHSQESMQQQAVVYEYKDFCYRKKFEDPLDKNSRRLIYIDQNYFDKTLPSYTPQFFTIMWRWDNNAPGLFFKEQIEENFPIEKLQAMLPVSNQVTRLSNVITKEINNIISGFTGSPNGQTTWTLVKDKITNYLTLQWRDGALMGTTVSEAFFVNVGLNTMTQTDITNGKLIVEVGLAFARPSEFVINRFEKQL